MKRRSAMVAGLAAAAAVVAGPALAQGRDAVSLRFNWYLGGLHAPFYLGKDRGYYADERIDLTLNEGRGSANTVQVIAAKSDTFGMADAGSLMNLAARGAPIRSVMSLLNTAGFGVISLAEAPIRNAEDLKGKRLAAPAGDALTQLLPAVLAVNGLKREDIQLVMVDPAAKPVTVMEKRADALLGGVDDQPFLIEAKGFKTHSVRFGDMGVNTVGMTILAHEDTLRQNPDMVRRFVAATVRTWEAAIKDPGAAIDAALKVKSDLNRDSTLGQLKVDLALLDSPASKAGGLGYGAAEDWERTLKLMKEFRDLQTDRTAASFYTNEFLPKR